MFASVAVVFGNAITETIMYLPVAPLYPVSTSTMYPPQHDQSSILPRMNNSYSNRLCEIVNRS